MKADLCREELNTKTEPELSIILPAYNKGDVIERVLNRVDNVNYRSKHEIIVVDDGSVDGTRAKAQNYADRNGHVRVIGYEKNRGKGNAIRTGLEYAGGALIAFIDCDLDINPEQIVDYINALGYADIAIAFKWDKESRVKMPMRRKFLSHAFNVLTRLLTGIKFRDTQTGLKVFRRSKLDRILSKLGVSGYAFDVELLAASNHCGLNIIQLPVKIQNYSMLGLREMLRMFMDLLGIAYKLRVLKYYQRPFGQFTHSFEQLYTIKPQKLKVPTFDQRHIHSEQIRNE